MIPGMMIVGQRIAANSAGGTLFDEIMADSPFMYLRLGESSGTTANNEAGATDGTYSGSWTMGQAALYTGGPTCVEVNADSTSRVLWPESGIPGTMPALTLGCVFQSPMAGSTTMLICRDRDSGGSRYWQWRIESTNIRWIKIAGGVEAVDRAHGLSANTPYILHVTVDSSGNVKLYKNGVQLGSTGTITAQDYGGAGSTTDIAIANRAAGSDALDDMKYSECFAIASAISDARIAAHAAAAGF